MSTLGKGILVRGEVSAMEDLMLEGRVEGPVLCEGFAVTVAESAQMTGDIVARDITVLGSVSGRLIATEVVDLRPSASVTGQVHAKRFVLDDGATFNGRVQPGQLEVALRVARFEQQKRKA
jgi:cytoskeletal protein CcmA (bactofilin family)